MHKLLILCVQWRKLVIYMYMINNHSFRTLLSSFLIIILLTTPLLSTPAEARTDGPSDRGNESDSKSDSSSGGSGREDSQNAGEGSGSKAGDEAAAEAKAEADKETAEAASKDVQEAANMAGVDVGVGAVDPTTDPTGVPGGSVTVDGKTMSVDAAISAIGAIADARDKGLNVSYSANQPGVDVGATLSAHARGQTGVVGSMSGQVGTPEQVGKAEVDHAGRQAAVSKAGSFDFGRFGPAPSKSLSQTLTGIDHVVAGFTTVATELIGVKAAKANPQAATEVTIGSLDSKTHRTTDVQAYEAWKTDTAASWSKVEAAQNAWDAAYDAKDKAAMDKAMADEEAALADVRGITQEHFGVSKEYVGLAGVGGGTGSGATTGGTSGVSGSPTGTTGAGTGTGAGIGTTGQSSGSKTTDQSYTYNDRAGVFTGWQTADNYAPRELNQAGRTAVDVASRATKDTVTTVDTTKGIISNFDTKTGNIQNFDYSGREATSASSQSGMSGGTGLSASSVGGYTVADTRPSTPATDLVTGKTDIGSVPGSLQEKAQAHGYNLDTPADILALGYVFEVDPNTRAAIINAYEADPSFSTLDDATIVEVSGILGAIAGEAARTNRTVAQQIAYPKYLSSVTHDGKAFTELQKTRTRTALSAFAEKLTDGSLSSSRGLDVTVPVNFSNHFYAAYANPSWASSVVNPTEVGQYQKTIVGYIPSEINPAAEGVRSAAVRSPALVSTDSLVQNTPGFSIVTKAPSTVMLMENLAEKIGLGTIDAEPLSEDEVEEADETEVTANPFGAIGVAHMDRIKNGVVPANYNLTEAAYTHPNSRAGFAVNIGFQSYVNTDDLSDRLEATLNEIALSIPNMPLSVTSGFRNSKYNKKVGGATRSQHIRGNAVDISLDNLTVAQQKALVDAVLSNPNVRGFGYYTTNNSIHFDVRTGAKSYWGGRTYGSKGFDRAANNGTIPGWMSTGVYGWHKDEYAGISGAAQATGQGAISPASTGATSPASSNPRSTRTTGIGLATVKSQLTEGTYAALSRMGVSRDNPIAKSLVPTLVGALVDSMIPTPVRVANELVSRNPQLADALDKVFELGEISPTDPSNDPVDGECTEGIEGETPKCPTTKQEANIWSAFQGNTSWLKWFVVSEPTTTVSETEQDNDETLPAVVTVTINAQTGEVELSRDDMITDLEQYIDQYSYAEILDLVSLFEEVPLIFSDDGEIMYSNGLYAPVIEDGYSIDDPSVEYTYVVKRIDENGELIETVSDTKALPENFVTRSLRQLLGNNSAFYIDEVDHVTYRLIDPDKDTLRDEYYDYVVHLKGGDVRAITIPEYTSVSFMEERFGSIGYQGDVLALIGLAYETAEEPSSLLSQVATFVKEYVSGFFDAEEPNEAPNLVTELPTLNTDIRSADISNIFIYPLADVNCPLIDGANGGFAYNAVVTDRANPDQVTIIADARCGTGSPAELTEETARHLSEKYGVSDMTYSTAVKKTIVRLEPIIHTSGVFTADLSQETETTEVPTETEEPTITEPTSTSTTQLPNLTNTVKLEAKAVGSDGKVLADWSEIKSITISPDVQLYFRWEASDYQQCLPFLNDNGNYSLTRENRAMITGNTEAEGYNITERTGTYKIECGGQRNNEFGVDYREIEVTVK